MRAGSRRSRARPDRALSACDRSRSRPARRARRARRTPATRSVRRARNAHTHARERVTPAALRCCGSPRAPRPAHPGRPVWIACFNTPACAASLRSIAMISGSVGLPSARSSPMFLPSVSASGHVVEHIVGNLERVAEIESVARERIFLLGGQAGQHRAEPRRRGEQHRGLAFDHIEIGALARVRIADVEQLQHLAFGDAVGGGRRECASRACCPARPSSGTSANKGNRRPARWRRCPIPRSRSGARGAGPIRRRRHRAAGSRCG